MFKAIAKSLLDPHRAGFCCQPQSSRLEGSFSLIDPLPRGYSDADKVLRHLLMTRAPMVDTPPGLLSHRPQISGKSHSSEPNASWTLVWHHYPAARDAQADPSHQTQTWPNATACSKRAQTEEKSTEQITLFATASNFLS